MKRENHIIDCSLLLQLWQDSGIVSAKKSELRRQKWTQIAEEYRSRKALPEPLEVKLLQNKWHKFIMGSNLLTSTSGEAVLAGQNDVVGGEADEVNNLLDESAMMVEVVPKVEPSASPATIDSDAASITATSPGEMKRKRRAAGMGGARKRHMTSSSSVAAGQNDRELEEMSETGKEALLNDTLLKSAEMELEAKREFWATKNKIAREELARAAAEKETALLNRNIAVANYNRATGKKIPFFPLLLERQ